MVDLKIVNGTIVDGSGKPRYRGDIGIKNGKIASIGRVTDQATETIDANGKIVAPGFIDVHTHYDAQAFWEPTLSPSCFHGVTTVIGGFCGFSIAPLSPDAADYLVSMLARVEGMPIDTLKAGVPWDWRSFGEYLSRLDGKIGLNAGFFAGHSAIRRVVMGDRAVGEKCTPTELDQMKTLLDQSLQEGALGFSTSISPTHNDWGGNPVPSRWADHSEIIELGRVVSKHDGTGLELLPELNFGQEVKDLITNFSLAGNRPVNWNALVVLGGGNTRQRAMDQLAVTDYARSKGGEVLALTVPCTPETYCSFKAGVVFDFNPGAWRELFKLPLEKRIRALRDPETRAQMEADAASVPANTQLAPFANIANYYVISVTASGNEKYKGRLVGEIAREEDRKPLDVMLDIALADDLTTVFAPNFGGHDRGSFELRGELWRDDRTLIGASDAGAHLDVIDTFAFSTTVLQKGVREFGVITLEEAIYQMTDRPARYVGLIQRGLLKEGYSADIVIFDEATVGRGPIYPLRDLPGAKHDYRLYADAIGIDHVFVNGVEIVRQGKHSGKLPGKVLRSGQDTRTVPMDAMRS